MDSNQSLDTWVNEIAKNGLPSLSTTVNAISKIDPNSDMPVDQLANFIQQDPGLTAHILRHTQGAYRVPLKGKNNTVNRAIVMLGFNEVKSLCFSLSVLEDLLHGSPRSEFIAQLGISFHAAIQARSIAFFAGQRNCEEIFTAVLLAKLGDLTFWSLGGDSASILSNEIKNNPGIDQETLERKSLGFSLQELTNRLSSSWNINNVLHFEDDTKNNILKSCLNYGYEIAENAQFGWSNPKLIETITNISTYTFQNFEETKNLIRENSITAIRYSLGFGIPGVINTIEDISSKNELKSNLKNEQIITADNSPYDNLSNKSDDRFLLKTIKGMGTLLEAGTNINELVKLSLEGMHKGLAFDRAIFCLLSPNRKFLMPKTYINSQSKILTEFLKIEIKADNIFGKCLFGETPIWAPKGIDEEEKLVLPSNIAETLSTTEFIIAPVIVDSSPIGLFYVDRSIRKSFINQEDFESFKQLVFQMRLALQHLHSINK